MAKIWFGYERDFSNRWKAIFWHMKPSKSEQGGQAEFVIMSEFDCSAPDGLGMAFLRFYVDKYPAPIDPEVIPVDPPKSEPKPIEIDEDAIFNRILDKLRAKGFDV